MTIDKDDRKEFRQALFDLQQAVESIKKDSANPHFKSKYAGLDAIWDGIKGHMKTVKMYSTATLNPSDGGGHVLTVEIVHAPSGASQVSQYVIPSLPNAQQVGSYITYLRRYLLSGLIGIVTTEDDDGNAAVEAEKKIHVPQKAASPKEKTEAEKIALAKQKFEQIKLEWAGFRSHDQLNEWALANKEIVNRLVSYDELDREYGKAFNDRYAELMN